MKLYTLMRKKEKDIFHYREDYHLFETPKDAENFRVVNFVWTRDRYKVVKVELLICK